MWCVMAWYVVWDGVMCDGMVCGVWWCGVVWDGVMWCVMVWYVHQVWLLIPVWSGLVDVLSLWCPCGVWWYGVVWDGVVCGVWWSMVVPCSRRCVHDVIVYTQAKHSFWSCWDIREVSSLLFTLIPFHFATVAHILTLREARSENTSNTQPVQYSHQNQSSHTTPHHICVVCIKSKTSLTPSHTTYKFIMASHTGMHTTTPSLYSTYHTITHHTIPHHIPCHHTPHTIPSPITPSH